MAQPSSTHCIDAGPRRSSAHLPLREPDDDLIPLLRKASSRDLGILVELIHRDRDQELSLVPEFRELNPRAEENIYDGDHRTYADDIAAEIQRHCGNTISNVFRGGKGVPYIEAVKDVADHLQVNYNEKAGVARIEREILLKVLEKASERMSDEERRELLKELGISNASRRMPPAFPGQFVQRAFRSDRLIAFVLAAMAASVVVNALHRPPVIYGTGMAASVVGPRTGGSFLGPVGLALSAGSAAWLLYDLGGPACRILVPCVVHVAYLRRKLCSCKECSELQPATANCCQSCGTRIEPVLRQNECA